MANPQAENGHVDIAHEIVEALACYRLSGQEWQCLLVVFRKTYGWKKTEDEISLSQFQRMTGLSRPGVVRALSKLVSKRVLDSTHIGTTHAKKYKFNKNYEQWLASTARRTSGNFKLVPKRVPQLVPIQSIVVVPKWVHTKETSTKETSKESSDRFGDFWKVYPRKVAKSAALKAWVKIAPQNGLVEKILCAVELQKNTEDWKKDKGKYIPHPATWLNGKRWEDEISCPKGDPGLGNPNAGRKEPGL